eukprot:756757-Hanusia_phi.AAC.2
MLQRHPELMVRCYHDLVPILVHPRQATIPVLQPCIQEPHQLAVCPHGRAAGIQTDRDLEPAVLEHVVKVASDLEFCADQARVFRARRRSMR